MGKTNQFCCKPIIICHNLKSIFLLTKYTRTAISHANAAENISKYIFYQIFIFLKILNIFFQTLCTYLYWPFAELPIYCLLFTFNTMIIEKYVDKKLIKRKCNTILKILSYSKDKKVFWTLNVIVNVIINKPRTQLGCYCIRN